MKCLFLSERGVQDGIAVAPEPFPHLAVGEGGPNRELTRVKIVGEFQPGQRLFQAEVQNMGEVPTLICGDTPAGTPRSENRNETTKPGHININWALVLVDIAGGPGGGTEWTSVHYDTAPCPHIGGTTTSRECDRCGYPSIDGRHPHEGMVRVYGVFEPNSSTITTVSKGIKGFGREGDEESHLVSLLVMRPGATLRVVRRGRIGSSFWQVYLRWDGAIMHFGRRDDVIPPSRPSGPLPL